MYNFLMDLMYRSGYINNYCVNLRFCFLINGMQKFIFFIKFFKEVVNMVNLIYLRFCNFVLNIIFENFRNFICVFMSIVIF